MNVSMGQVLYGMVLDDYLMVHPLGQEHFSCLEDMNGGTTALSGGRAVVLSVDANLFAESGSGAQPEERAAQFLRLLQHYKRIAEDLEPDQIRLLFFPERPHMTAYLGLTDEQKAVLEQGGLRNQVLLECLDSASNRLTGRVFPIPGLYFLEEGRVRHRYLRYPWYLPQDPELEGRIADLVREDVRSFLHGRDPAHVPLPLLDLNVAVPAGLQSVVGKPRFLLMSFSGLEAEAPAEDRIVIEERVGSLGGKAQMPSFESGHPGAAGRRVIELLTPLLARHDLAALALVKEPGRVEAMRRAFPEWSFIALEEPGDYLRYWEALNFSYFASGGKVRHVFAITPFDLGLGFARPFEKLLEGWVREAR